MNTRLEETTSIDAPNVDIASVPGLDDIQSAAIGLMLVNNPEGVVVRTNKLHEYPDPKQQLTITSLDQVRALEG